MKRTNLVIAAVILLTVLGLYWRAASAPISVAAALATTWAGILLFLLHKKDQRELREG